MGRLGRSVKDGDGKGLVSAAVEYGSAQDPGPGLAASKTQGEVQRSRGPAEWRINTDKLLGSVGVDCCLADPL